MDLIILAVLVFIVWKTMKFVYDMMNKKITKTNEKNNVKDIDDDK